MKQHSAMPPGTRLITAMISTGIGLLLIVGFNFLSFEIGDLNVAEILVNKKDSEVDYFAVQNVMWIFFTVGLGELWVRFQASSKEEKELGKGYLPEDDRAVLMSKHLPELYRGVRASDRQLILPRLIRRINLRFQKTNSIEQANSLLTSSIDMIFHEIELRYNFLRYIMWAIPTLGFIGTVVGISLALGTAGNSDPSGPNLLSNVTGELAVAFYTTLVALVMSGILVLILHWVQEREEGTLNRAGQYCLDNLINRLFEGDQQLQEHK